MPQNSVNLPAYCRIFNDVNTDKLQKEINSFLNECKGFTFSIISVTQSQSSVVFKEGDNAVTNWTIIIFYNF